MFGADGILYALGAAVVVALVAFMKGRLDGARAERNALARERLEARTEADKIDQAVAGMTDEEVLKGQGKWSRPKR